MELEKILNYKFKSPKLLEQALTHSSFSYESQNRKIKNNERLEFLGDAVLEFAVSSYLFRKFPKMPEGDLTKLRSKIVCELSLAKIARHFELNKFLRIGRGEELTGGRDRDSTLSDVFEAVIGAMYLDGGADFVLDFVSMTLCNLIDELTNNFQTLDYKTTLQELIQKKSLVPLKYTILSQQGPDHDKTFVVNVSHEDKILGEGSGKTKKEAEQDAAKEAIKKIKPKA